MSVKTWRVRRAAAPSGVPCCSSREEPYPSEDGYFGDGAAGAEDVEDEFEFGASRCARPALHRIPLELDQELAKSMFSAMEAGNGDIVVDRHGFRQLMRALKIQLDWLSSFRETVASASAVAPVGQPEEQVPSGTGTAQNPTRVEIVMSPELLNRFLSFHMNLLELDPDLSGGPATGNFVNLVPRNVIFEGVGHDDNVVLKVRSLEVLGKLCVTVGRQVKLVATHWRGFLSGSEPPRSYRLAIFDLLAHPDASVRLACLMLTRAFIHTSGGSLLLAKYSQRTASFTPLSVQFAVSLRNLVHMIIDLVFSNSSSNIFLSEEGTVVDNSHLNLNDPPPIVKVTKALVTILEKIPFHRLEPGILTLMAEKLLRAKRRPNLQQPMPELQMSDTFGPTIMNQASSILQVHLLQVCSALIKAALNSTKANQKTPGSTCASLSDNAPREELVPFFHDFYQIFASRAFPSQFRCSDDNSSLTDRNISYQAVQCLATLVELDAGLFLAEVEREGRRFMKEMASVFRQDPDHSLCLHFLRLCKTIGICGQSLLGPPEADQDRLEDHTSLMLLFWCDFIVPVTFDFIERRQKANLIGALCDCLSEVGETVFSQLPSDKRILCMTRLLRPNSKIGSSSSAESRIVSISQLRSIGKFLTWFSCYSDPSFVIDCAEILLKSSKKPPQQAHKLFYLSSSWATANLLEALASTSKRSDVQPQLVGRNKADSGSGADGVGMVLELEFPPELILEFVKVVVVDVKVKGHHFGMNPRANTARSLGALFRCLDHFYCSMPEVCSGDSKFVQACRDVVGAIIGVLCNDRFVKVNWNACYASCSILGSTSSLFNDERMQGLRSSLVEKLVGQIENYPNMKVRIASALAISCVPVRDILGGHLMKALTACVRSLDNIRNFDGDGAGEAEVERHRLDLQNQLCLTMGHLLTLCSDADLTSINRYLGEHSVEMLTQCFKAAAIKLSPEKASKLFESGHILSDRLAANESKEGLLQLRKILPYVSLDWDLNS